MLSSCCRNLTWLLILRVVWICRIIFQGKLGILKNHHSFVNFLELGNGLGICGASHAHPLTFDIDLKLFCITYSVCTCMIYLFLFNQQVQQCSVPPRCSRGCSDRWCGLRRLERCLDGLIIYVILFWRVFGCAGDNLFCRGTHDRLCVACYHVLTNANADILSPRGPRRRYYSTSSTAGNRVFADCWVCFCLPSVLSRALGKFAECSIFALYHSVNDKFKAYYGSSKIIQVDVAKSQVGLLGGRDEDQSGSSSPSGFVAAVDPVADGEGGAEAGGTSNQEIWKAFVAAAIVFSI